MFTEPVQLSRAQQRAETAKRVVESAQRLFLTDGYRRTTVRAIAEAAGVSVGTVMSVGDKDALLVAAYDDWIGGLHRKRPARAASADPAVRVADVVAPFLDLFESAPELSREYGVVLARGAHPTEVFGALAQTLLAEFEAVFREAGLDARAPRAARTVYLVYLGLVMTSGATRRGAAAIRAEVEDAAADLLAAR